MNSITFGGVKDMNLFWGYVKVLLGAVSNWVMLAVAVVAVGLLLGIVVKAWKESSKDVDHSDDDIEYREY